MPGTSHRGRPEAQHNLLRQRHACVWLRAWPGISVMLTAACRLLRLVACRPAPAPTPPFQTQRNTQPTPNKAMSGFEHPPALVWARTHLVACCPPQHPHPAAHSSCACPQSDKVNTTDDANRHNMTAFRLQTKELHQDRCGGEAQAVTGVTVTGHSFMSKKQSWHVAWQQACAQQGPRTRPQTTTSTAVGISCM